MGVKQTEAMKAALTALKSIDEAMPFPVAKFAIRQLEEALAEQPAQQEPLAYSYTSRITGAQGFSHHPMPRFIDSESWDIKPLYTSQPASKPWADECRIELVNAIHFLASDFENALGAFGGDTEARRKAEGDIAHARSIASRWNWNGTTAQPSKPLTDEQIWDEVKAADLDWQTGWSLDEDTSNRYITFARAIEAAHGIKE